ncbi:Calpain-type cysteine protease DEK1 [Seminavis robusta]|uniref:Calpain-type cysteine protease DEK1 n=1 Tax=Seminavis robusta TaxID=568900 RepID=A0A9N8DX54_9STRA|nr:Calpain-type cysteine protease DEK1 [Seminavis robusta]|eukprot:Sro348_g123130.1 Calpain-type cysteine protease DEK1 (1057) ;mRNA; f:1464-4751
MPRRASFTHLKRPYEEGRLLEEVNKLGGGTLFADKEFPPTVASLIDRREVPPFVVDVPKFTQRTAWKRAHDIWKNDDDKENKNKKGVVLYTMENLKPTAVKQGGLENCYFLASLTSLSLYPERVTRLFLPSSNPDCGIYAVRFFCNGRPNEVVVDDWLPIKKGDDPVSQAAAASLASIPKNAKVTIQSKTNNGDGTETIVRQIEHPDGRMQLKKTTTDIEQPSGKLQFSKTSTDELWVPMVEKAYAKVQGTYAQLEAGCHFETLRDLTGAPGFYYKSVDVDRHGLLMEEFYRQRFPMSCGIDYTYNMPWSDEQLDSVGLLADHAYSILAVCTVNTKQGKPQRLVKLRNPWGDAKEWTGDWGNTSPQWTPAIRDQIRKQGIPLEADPNAEDGIFWMAWEDFARYYNSWDVNQYQDHYHFSAAMLQDKPAVGYHLVTVHVQQAGEYTFGITQCSNRMLPPSAKYEYSSVRAILVKAPENPAQDGTPSLAGCQFIKGVVGEQRDEYIQLDQGINPGMYYLFVQVWWDPSSKHLPHPREISVNCYGTARVKFAQDVAAAHDKIEVLTEIFAAKARREMAASHHFGGAGEQIICRSRGQPDAQGIQEYYNRNTCPEGYHFRLFTNTETNNVVLQEDKKFSSLHGAELVRPQKNTANYKVTGKDAYSIRVGPGETKGVFLMVKKTFGMAGPMGAATMILGDGRTEREQDSKQKDLTSSYNIPDSTGVQQTAAPVEQLTTMHVGGTKGGGRRRSSGGFQALVASLRGSTNASSVKATQGKKKKKRGSIFGFLFGGNKKMPKDNESAKVPDSAPAPATAPVQQAPVPAPPMQEPTPPPVPAQTPAPATPQHQDQSTAAPSAAKAQPSTANNQASSIPNTGDNPGSSRERFASLVQKFNGEENTEPPTASSESTPKVELREQAEDNNTTNNNNAVGAGTSGNDTDDNASGQRNTAASHEPSPTAASTAKPEISPGSREEPATSKTETSKPSKGLFASLFGGEKRRKRGRKATPTEEKMLEPFPDLRQANVVENTTTVEEKTVTDEVTGARRVVATTTTTTLRLVK